MQPLQKCALMTTWALVSALSMTTTVGCGAEGPGSEESPIDALEASGGAGGAGLGGANAGGTDDDGASTSSGSTASSSSSSSSGSGSSSSASGPGSTGSGSDCSIMSSNTTCADCLAQNCCMVINACMDEAYLSCVGCIDSFLSGDGDVGCDQTVGKNNWVVECVSFNCVDECAEG